MRLPHCLSVCQLTIICSIFGEYVRVSRPKNVSDNKSPIAKPMECFRTLDDCVNALAGIFDHDRGYFAGRRGIAGYGAGVETVFAYLLWMSACVRPFHDTLYVRSVRDDVSAPEFRSETCIEDIRGWGRLQIEHELVRPQVRRYK